LIAHAAWMPDPAGNREREAAVEAAAPVEKSNTLRCFLPPVLGKVGKRLFHSYHSGDGGSIQEPNEPHFLATTQYFVDNAQTLRKL